MSNSRLEVSTSLDRNNNIIIGDTEKVLDIKNQYLITTYSITVYRKALEIIKKIKNLSCAEITGEEFDNYTDLHFYPLIDIKIKGSGINDILKKNNHAPTGFFCIHDSTNLHRRTFDLYDTFFRFTKKKYLVKSIKITCGSICFFPISNNLEKNPFIEIIDFKNENPKSFEEYDLDKINLFQKELNSLKKQKNKKRQPGQIVKYIVDNGTYDVYNPIHNGDKLIFVIKK